MKNVVDHRILIPRSSATVWQYLSDLSNNVHWQTDCESVSFVTSRRSGVGVRWRNRAPGGHDSVIETTAWYEGLGYEYSYIDSGAFRENRGRIRLQEIPEGTVVQWTFSYDTKGLIGGLRNTLGLRRQTEAVMMDSLRMLWRKLNQSSGEPIREAKSLIREAPGYEERSRYKPRHPSKLEVTDTPAEAVPPVPVIKEPPLAEDDTRPSVRVLAPEPDFLSGFDEPDSVADSVWKKPVLEEAQPVVPEAPPVEPAALVPVVEPSAAQAEIPETSAATEVNTDEPPAEAAAEEPRPEPPPIAVVMPEESQPVDLREELHEEAATVAEIEPPAESAASQSSVQHETIPAEVLASMDTREISVFDIFGLPKPSETQELSAVVSQPLPVVIPMVSGGRVGLRMVQRRKLVRLRRPS